MFFFSWADYNSGSRDEHPGSAPASRKAVGEERAKLQKETMKLIVEEGIRELAKAPLEEIQGTKVGKDDIDVRLKWLGFFHGRKHHCTCKLINVRLNWFLLCSSNMQKKKKCGFDRPMGIIDLPSGHSPRRNLPSGISVWAVQNVLGRTSILYSYIWLFLFDPSTTCLLICLRGGSLLNFKLGIRGSMFLRL
ncbi:methionine--tRNA ligase, chloroplastic/mitochondrial isoform X1 [Iris pallida]|uniref:Methionine--tRNA ligase, chloroplastic/mitochondrial isoform X1 n=1 Tax=Iris pallida TaxID=29817 RepID=A0AAX6HVL5_IRIPA|nr:methionine--tRNA ligase, chloroplastic/mitochondrial isoform X1 [Iris pallida]